jgi:DNA end-binding protein Ku
VPRAVWTGAITFGLVHLPVSLLSAVDESRVDFQWLDRKSLDPVGYKRYNKRTGRELALKDIVKGVRQTNGKYVVLNDEEIKAAFPKSTQTIQIEAFVKLQELPTLLLERPYYIQPDPKSEKVYVLLREAMRAAGVAAVARIVIHNKEHLAAILITESALILETLRWSGTIRPTAGLRIPASSTARANIRPEEQKMAAQLIDQMTGPWKPEAHAAHFAEAIAALIKRRVAAGRSQSVAPLEDVSPVAPPSNVVNLTELLAQSMRARRARRRAS